jgi:hypothetical protein
MNKLFLISLIFLFIFPVNAQKSIERENVVNLIKQFDKAVAKKDSVTLKNIITDNFIGSIPNGQSYNKKSFITYNCNPHSKIRELKDESSSGWNIIISDDCAIVNRTVTYSVKTPGKESVSEIKIKKLEVCLKIKNKWMLASVQGTEVL